MSKINYATIEQPQGSDFPTVHCPICGQPTIVKDEEGYGEMNACKHLAFIFTGASQDFEYITDEFQETLDTLEVEENEERYDSGFHHSSFPLILEDMGYGNKFLALEITHGSGPVWFTDVFGFDYSKMVG